MKSKFQGQMSDLEESWDEDCLKFGFQALGMRIAGEIAVGDSDLAVRCDLPLAAMMFKGKIQSEMQQQLSGLMS